MKFFKILRNSEKENKEVTTNIAHHKYSPYRSIFKSQEGSNPVQTFLKFNLFYIKEFNLFGNIYWFNILIPDT